MDHPETTKKLNGIAYLLTANLLVMAIGTAGLILGLLPKLERITVATERVEQRFQSFANEVQPVVSSGAGKAVESINKVDSDRLSREITEQSDQLIEAAADKAMRLLDRRKKDEKLEE